MHQIWPHSANAIKLELDSFQATIELLFWLFSFDQRAFPFLNEHQQKLKTKKNINIYKSYRNLRLQINAKNAILN